MLVCRPAAVLALLFAALTGPVLAPAAAAQEVVQPLPNPASAELAEAMERIARRPSSVPALVAAGEASLKLDDAEAALGFFSRAQLIAPEDPRVLSGLALVALRRGDAVTALQLFDNAEAAGQAMGQYAAERGLAYDLAGDNVRAQRSYRRALQREDNPAITRRLALSYAISGDGRASEEVLLPLLQRQDRAAFRARAFALAILGETEEAVTIAEAMLPARVATRIVPYLRYMPRLTRAQQAAAANLGRFPPAAQIGRDDPRLAAMPESVAAPAPQAAPDSRLIPGGEPLGPRSVAAANAEPPPPREDLAAAMAAFTPLAPEATSEPLPGPSFSLTDSVPAEQPAAAATPSLVDVFADLPLVAGTPAARAANAVDITAIEPAREAAAPPPATPAHPARHWVQVATGRDLAAFRFDWRRLRRAASGLLDGSEAFHAAWGSTNRLLTGPFASAREAQRFVTTLAEAGVDSFAFSSQNGQEISRLE